MEFNDVKRAKKVRFTAIEVPRHLQKLDGKELEVEQSNYLKLRIGSVVILRSREDFVDGVFDWDGTKFKIEIVE